MRAPLRWPRCCPPLGAITVPPKVERQRELWSAGPGRISMGLTSKVTGTSYHFHLSEVEAQRLAAFINERIEINVLQSLR